MPIELYKKKPSAKAVKNYKEKIEKFLSAHGATITVLLRDKPTKERPGTGKYDSIKYDWIKNIILFIPKKGYLPVNVMSEGIDEDMSDWLISHDAIYIQDQMYRALRRRRTPPKDDVYWKAWEYTGELSN
ncbi:MAG: hypothetical protein WC470_02195 [Candidatus Paceibacterota bacterium]